MSPLFSRRHRDATEREDPGLVRMRPALPGLSDRVLECLGDGEELSVETLVARTGAPTDVLVLHLQQLARAHLVTCTKRGGGLEWRLRPRRRRLWPARLRRA